MALKMHNNSFKDSKVAPQQTNKDDILFIEWNVLKLLKKLPQFPPVLSYSELMRLNLSSE